jgi:hypothetical protein
MPPRKSEEIPAVIREKVIKNLQNKEKSSRTRKAI